jgi:hypothetical protein
MAGKMQARSARRRQHEHAVRSTPVASTAADDLSWRETCGALHDELNHLPERYRAPLLLCYWEGLTQEEAAHYLGLPRGTLKRRLESGREKLRKKLARRGLELSAILLALALNNGRAEAAMPGALVRSTVASAARVACAVGASGGSVSSGAALLAIQTLRAALATGIRAAAVGLGLGVCIAVAAVDPLGLKAQTEPIESAAHPPEIYQPPNAPGPKLETVAPGDIPATRVPIGRPAPHGIM